MGYAAGGYKSLTEGDVRNYEQRDVRKFAGMQYFVFGQENPGQGVGSSFNFDV